MVHFFRDGGPLMYPILLCACVGWIWVLFFAVPTAFKFRVPAAVVTATAALAVMLGSLGTYVGLSMANEAIEHASWETVGALAAMGYGIAHYTDLFGMIVGSGLFGLAALALGIGGAIGAGSGAKFTPISAGVIGVVGLLGAVVVFGIGFTSRLLGIGEAPLPGSLWMGQIVFFSLMGIAASSLRFHGESRVDQERAAANRVGVSVAALLAIVFGARGWWLMGDVQTFEAIARASTETKMTMMAMGLSMSQAMWWVGLAAVLFWLVAAVVAVAPVVSFLSGTRSVIGGVLMGLLLASMAAVGGLQRMEAAAVLEHTEVSTFWRETSGRVGQLPTWDGTGQSPAGTCVVYREGGWVGQQRSDQSECPAALGPLDLPLGPHEFAVLVLGAETKARTIADTRWHEGPNRLHILTYREPEDYWFPGMEDWHSYPSTVLEWHETAPWEPRRRTEDPASDFDLFEDHQGSVLKSPLSAGGPLLIEERSSGADVVFEGRSLKLGAPADLEQLLEDHGSYETAAILVPGERWTLNDLVAWCGPAAIRGGCMLMSSEALAPTTP